MVRKCKVAVVLHTTYVHYYNEFVLHVHTCVVTIVV